MISAVAAAYFTNLRTARDYDLDEVMYTIAGQHVAADGSISWGQQPTAVHPPLHFLLLGLWSLVTGASHAAVVPALFDARIFGVLATLLSVALVGLLARHFTASPWLIGAAMLLTGFDAFVLAFGRTALIEPTAVLAEVAVVYLAIRLRRSSVLIYVGAVGGVSGLALLVKEPLLFTVVVPVLAAVLSRDWALVRRAVAAVVVALLIWSVFPLWAVSEGAGAWWKSEHDVSAARLFGFLQVSGLNRSGVSSSAVFADTFVEYAAGYLIFLIGAAGLLHLILRYGALRGRRLDGEAAWLVSFGLLSYGFLGYCVLLGQANEQLSIYSAIPAVLLTLFAWGEERKRIAAAVCVVAAVAGITGWAVNVASVRDDATTRMSAMITSRFPCQAVNATGNAPRWSPALTRNHVTAYTDGSLAQQSGVHLFLLSTKDSRLRYGNSSPELDSWVRDNGTPLYRLESRRYETIELWSVPGEQPALTNPCSNAATPVAANASSARFVAMLIGALTLIALAISGIGWAVRRSAT
ncbi:ArnT family glycosyltransferase [Dactylosporangium sp. CA-092794]|uniref:ArnT family glycosyltransferase n=1 Tax=Dactylosporangium sp. CA-092794 TaxID=3239929 RepID=UPI003D8F4096